MDKASLARIAALRTSAALVRLQRETGNDTRGTVFWLEIIRRYVLIFCSTKLDCRGRCVNAAFVCTAVRVIRESVREDGELLCIKTSFCPRPTARHLIASPSRGIGRLLCAT